MADLPLGTSRGSDAVVPATTRDGVRGRLQDDFA